jgi:hypothetical protein
MAKLTMAFGVVLIALGIGFFVATGNTHPTSLIASAFGLLLLICGALANSPDAGRRMLWMHIAVTIGLFGFLFPGFMTVKALVAAQGAPLARPTATLEQGVMAVICLIFVGLCVRSFIAARRARVGGL